MSSNNFLRSPTKGFAAVAFALFTSLLVVACGGGDSVVSTTRYTIGGSASGLVGSGLVLQDNGVDSLTVSASGSFAFATPLTNGSSYAVTVATQPTNPAQTCVVSSGSGTVNGANVQSIAVACSTNGYTVGGAVSGLIGSGLVLQDNGGDDLPISAAGTFTFSQTVGSGVAYAVTVKTQPTNPNQTCTVVAGSGTMGSANVTDVAVNCATSTFTVSGTITGLVGAGLVLQTSGVNIPITGSTFSIALASGTAYNVVVTQPSNPTQNCVVVNGSGTITNANVSNVTVTCTTGTFTVGGTITGLSGTGLVLQTNGTNVPISGSTFGVTLVSGTAYNIVATVQPSSPTQTCVVGNPSGTVTNANISSVTVTCTTKTYTLSGTITGLSGSGLALQTNGTNIPISGSAFSVVLASGTPYSVTVTAQPSTPTQNCVVGNGTGTITNAPISNVTVVCTTRTFTVSGTISGLAGTGLVLQTSGTNVPITGSAFSVTLASGTAYNIRATTQPSSPTQNCVPANNTGTVTNANINNVTVTCTTTNFTVSGTISGLTGSGLVLQTNATPVTITSNTFSVTLASGTAYAIIAQTQPQSPAQYCVVTNGTGTVAGANVTNVVVGCRNQGVYAFVADSGAATVSAFNITSNSGLLTFDTAASTPVTTSFPSGIAVEVLPAGATYLYTADFNTADIAKFSFDPTTLPQPTVAYVSSFSTGIAPATSTGPGSTPTAITIDPTGQFVLVADSQNAAHDTATTTPGAILVFAINQTTGDLTPATGGLSTATAIAPGNYTSSVAATVIPADTPYVFATNQFAPPIGIAGFSFNNPATSGTLTQLAPWQATTGNNPVWVTVDPLDRFVYVSNSTDGTVSGWVLGTDGTLTAMPGSPFGRGFSPAATTGAIAIDPTGRFLYVTDLANNQVVGFTIDQSPGPTAGALTAMTTGSPFATGPGPFPVNVDPSGHFVYVGNTFVPSISMFTADPNTGILTPVGGSPLTFGGVSGRGANAMAIE